MALITVERGDLKRVCDALLSISYQYTAINSVGSFVVAYCTAEAAVGVNTPDEAVDIALKEVDESNSFAQVIFQALVDRTAYEVHVYDDYTGEEIAGVPERDATAVDAIGGAPSGSRTRSAVRCVAAVRRLDPRRTRCSSTG